MEYSKLNSIWNQIRKITCMWVIFYIICIGARKSKFCLHAFHVCAVARIIHLSVNYQSLIQNTDINLCALIIQLFFGPRSDC